MDANVDKLAAELQRALAYAEDIIDTLREPFVVLDKSLWVRRANASFYTTFKVSKEETENRSLFELGNGQWNVQRLREILRKVMSDQAIVEAVIRTTDVEIGQDYLHDHPEVRPGSYVCLAVSDTGVGMSQEAISHLFEPFYTTHTGIGAGLGLAAAYGFVKQCNGDIEVQSQPEKGTTVRIYLPRPDGDFERERHAPITTNPT